eukprot:EG_transcript_8901
MQPTLAVPADLSPAVHRPRTTAALAFPLAVALLMLVLPLAASHLRWPRSPTAAYAAPPSALARPMLAALLPPFRPTPTSAHGRPSLALHASGRHPGAPSPSPLPLPSLFLLAAVAAGLSAAGVALARRPPRPRAVGGDWVLAAADGSLDGGLDDPSTQAGDWREFRALMVQAEAHRVSVEEACGANLTTLRWQAPALAERPIWAHPLSHPETGCLLVAHPRVPDDDPMARAVVFVLHHSPAGAVGVLLNRPSHVTLEHYQNGRSRLGTITMYTGGAQPGFLALMADDVGIAEAYKIIPGVFSVPMDKVLACDGVRSSVDFKTFAGTVMWKAGQLERECEREQWWPVAASPAIIIKPATNLPKPLWAEVLGLCGGQLAEAARHPGPDAAP